MNERERITAIIVFLISICVFGYVLISLMPVAAAEDDLLEEISGSEFLREVIDDIPSLEVYIWLEPYKHEYQSGEVVTIHSALRNQEYYDEILYQWQISDDDIEWEDLDGENFPILIFPVDEGMAYKYFRLIVHYR